MGNHPPFFCFKPTSKKLDYDDVAMIDLIILDTLEMLIMFSPFYEEGTYPFADDEDIIDVWVVKN